MRRVRGSTILTTLVALTVSMAPAPAMDIDMEAAFDAFYKVGLAEGTIAVRDVVLEREDFELHLTDGVFIPAIAIAGLATGGVYLGEGEVVFQPSQVVDRRVLRRRLSEWLKKPGTEYRSQISAVVLRFSDATLSELGEASEVPVDRAKAESHWKARNKILNNIETLGPFHRKLTLEIDLLEQVMNGLDRDFFLADFLSVEDGWLFYLENQGYIQEIFFGQRKGLGAQEEIHPFVITNQAADFDREGRYELDEVEDDKLTFDIDHYRLSVIIPDTARVLMDASIDITPRKPLRAVRFDLVNSISLSGQKWTDRSYPVDVTKVTDEAGNELEFLHKRHTILVELPEPLAAGERTVLSFSAEEKTVIQLSPESYWLLNTYPWFPQSGFVGGRHTHDWTVKVKRPLVGVVSGRLIREWREKDMNCSAWVMDEAVQFPSLIFGKFVGEEFPWVSELTGEEISIRVFTVPRVELGDLTFSGTKKAKPVAAEAKVILALFEDLYGPYPYDYLNIAQMAVGMGFGQAPPGLIQLTGEAFMSSATIAMLGGRGDFFHEFFAHEVAHQWWAHVVWGTSFRDAWFSESFAEYSAGLYWQQYRGARGFQSKLKEWRQNAMMARGTAPIAALSTLGGDRAIQYYTQNIYNKGPYVVHMLRMQMGHDKWVEGMRNFFEKYRHTNTTTERFIDEMEEVVGYELDFFFDQWWQSASIPSFEFTYDVKPTEDGRFLFEGRITQSGQPFKVMMPIFFHFGGDEISIQNRLILEATDTYQAYLPKKPNRVTLDDFNTLLAEIKQGGGGGGDEKGKKKGKKGKKTQ